MRPAARSPLLHAALLAALCFAIYSNNFRHEFQLDDGHLLTTNLAVRSLANIPQYFVDPGTFTSLRANVDYRPVLQVTYALNYQMGGYDTWWWHLTQILLHAACAIGLYFFCRRVVLQVPSLRDDAAAIAFVPLLAAAVFAVHPTGSGVVNYLSARSSLLTAAFLLPSLLLYMVPGDNPRYGRPAWAAALLFALAIFTKVEAIGCLAVYFLWDVWQTGVKRNHERGFLADIWSTLTKGTLRRIWPLLAVAAVYFLVRARVMAPFELDQSRRAFGVTAFEYLLTQTVVWWRYVLNWFAPVSLVADNGNYPVFRSLLDGPVLLAVGSWLAIGAAIIATWKSRPQLAFLCFSALALISPTSSIAPLAEMLNEHRPYLPLAVLSLCWMIPLGAGALRVAPTQRSAGAAISVGVALLLAGFATLTWQRNRVFATTRSYLEDLVAKAPSGRTFNNYGLLFMQEGNYPKALGYFNDALRYTPSWYIVHTNLAIAYNSTGDSARAEQHHDLAVQYDTWSGSALTWRGEYRLSKGRYREAATDFEQAGPKSLERYRLCKDLATAYAGLGLADKSWEYTSECIKVDQNQTVLDATSIVKPFFDSPALAPAGLAYFEKFDKAMPDTWWIHHNIGTLAARTGDTARANAEWAMAKTLKGN